MPIFGPIPPVGYSLRLPRVSYDPAAADYFTGRTSVVSSRERFGFNDFALQMKAASKWTRCTFILPLVGGGFADVLTPLKGAFTVTNSNFVSGDFSATSGLKGNGTTKSLSTGVRNDAITIGSFALGSYFTELSVSNGGDFVFGRGGEAVIGTYRYFGGVSYAFGGGQNTSVANDAFLGFDMATRVSATDLRQFRNGRQIGTTQTASGTTAPANAAENGRVFAVTKSDGSGVDTWSNRRIGLVLLMDGATPTDVTVVSGLVARLMHYLGGPLAVVGPYLSCCFDDNSNERLTMMQSADGLAWTFLPCTYGARLRDPSLMVSADLWAIAFTTSLFTGGSPPFTTSNSFGIAACIPYTGTFELIATVDCSSIPGVQFVFGPKWDVTCFPGEKHIVVCITTDPTAVADFKMYDLTITNLTLSGATATLPLEITGSGLSTSLYDAYRFYNPDDGSFFMQAVDASGGGGTFGIVLMRSTTGPNSGYTLWKDKATHNSGVREGCSMVYVGPGHWIEYAVLIDTHTQKCYRESFDGMVTFGSWTDITAPTNTDNGTVLKLP